MGKRVFLAIAVVLAGHSEAWSHPGHGELHPTSSPLHYVLEPAHQWPWLLVAIGVATLFFLATRTKWLSIPRVGFVRSRN